MSNTMEKQAAPEMMNYSSSSEPMTSVGSTTSYRIRRNGARPLRFEGTELGMAMSFSPEIPYWYELNVYRTVAGSFVLAIRKFFQSTERMDNVEAWEFKSLDEALDQIENYDPAADIDISLASISANASVAELMAQMLSLRSTMAELRRHYGSLAGEFLDQLDAH